MNDQTTSPVGVEVVTLTPSGLLFSSSNRTAPALASEELTAEPVNVMFTVFTAIEPAELAEKDNVASWSVETLPRPEVAPSGVAAKASVLRKTVCGLPAALPVVATVSFDVAPTAVTPVLPVTWNW